MPIRKQKKGSKTCYKVEGTTTKKCMTKKQAEEQLKAIKARKKRKK